MCERKKIGQQDAILAILGLLMTFGAFVLIVPRDVVGIHEEEGEVEGTD